MICSSCSHGLVQKVSLGDLDWQGRSMLREIFNCDLVSKEVVKLVECSRYVELKGVKVDFEVKPEIVDLGYGAVPKKRGRPRKGG
jgi:hypothetical protein